MNEKAGKPDMLMSMLSKMVGIEPAQFQSTIEDFVKLGQNIGVQMNRIEANQLAMIEAMNDDRKRDGKPLIGYTGTDGVSYNRDSSTVSGA